MVELAALDAPKMAQDLVPCQRLPGCGTGYRQAGQNRTPGLTSRVSLHVGHLIFVSLILFSLAIGVNRSGDLIPHMGLPLPGRVSDAGEARPA